MTHQISTVTPLDDRGRTSTSSIRSPRFARSAWVVAVLVAFALAGGCDDGEDRSAAATPVPTSTSPVNAPPDAECKRDSDCPPPDDPDCAEVFCETRATFTCQIRAKRVGQPCTSGAGLCASGSGSCGDQGRCLAPPKACPAPESPCLKTGCDPATGACTYTPVADGTPCFAQCTTGSTCVAGQCQGGTSTCVDTPCAKATCSPDQGCTYQAISPAPSCDDGDACTENDTCSGGSKYESPTCKGKPIELDCSSLESGCMFGACDPTTGACVKRPALPGALCGGAGCSGGECSGFGTCTTSKTDAITPLFVEDFAGPLIGWSLTGQWQFPSMTITSPPHDATIGNGENGLLLAAFAKGSSPIPESVIEPPEITVTAAKTVTVSFWQWRSSPDQNNGFMPEVDVVLQTFAGNQWSPVGLSSSGAASQSAWRERRAQVAVKSGKLRVRLMFNAAFNYSNEAPRFAIDHFVVGTLQTCETP